MEGAGRALRCAGKGPLPGSQETPLLGDLEQVAQFSWA
uniref:Macaca fascicularis brain cDNA clone: QflA-22773, similar to human hypothetical gene supported by AK124096 (LOC399923), mRNA, RefSeq: XM_374906.1 n=1 Tax=Macaca fascicularis TaxID=9541 RepID=I7GIU8_MACFA|nr:unnamed protein product [Macaca fascicularis]